MIFNHGTKRVYQRCGKEHLHRYVAKFDFWYNSLVKLGCGDEERAKRVLKGVVERRLTYRWINQTASKNFSATLVQ